MPTIRLNDSEIEHLRAFYTDELKEAVKYVGQVRTIVAKLKTKDKLNANNPVPTMEGIQPAKKRGRKPTVNVDHVSTEVPQPFVRKTKAPKIAAATPSIEPAKKRGRKPSVKDNAVKTEVAKPKVKAKRTSVKKVAKPKKIFPEVPSVVPAEKIGANAKQEKPTVTVEPKPKRKRIHNSDHKGKILLAGWNKSVPKKPKGNPPNAINDKI